MRDELCRHQPGETDRAGAEHGKGLPGLRFHDVGHGPGPSLYPAAERTKEIRAGASRCTLMAFRAGVSAWVANENC